MREIIAAGLTNPEFIDRATSGFEAYKASVEPYTLARGEELTGVKAEVIRELAHSLARSKRKVVLIDGDMRSPSVHGLFGKRNERGDILSMNVKKGDRVLFGKYSGQTVKVDGDELLVMREEDLFAVVEK